MIDKLALSIPEAASASGLGRTLLYQDIAEGRLRAVKRGRRTLVLLDDLKTYLAGLETFKAQKKEASDEPALCTASYRAVCRQDGS